MDQENKEEYHLEKHTQPDSATNYEFLRAKGLELVQKYAGGTWTDYNLHDPGVTILEYLSYAITDLGYRTGFDIRDILAEKDGSIDIRKNLFYPAARILTSKPQLVNDLRKLVIDSIPEVHNVWIVPAMGMGGVEEKGLSDVLIQLSEDHYNKHDQADTDHPDPQTISDQVRNILCSVRNIGEDFRSFTILEPASITIEAEVVVERHQMYEELLADVYDRISRYITPPIVFYSQTQLEKEGLSVEEIFSGPSLKHGFIKDEELKEKVNVLDPSDLIQTILSIPGVKYVRNFQMKYEGATYDIKPLHLPAHCFPRFIFNAQEPDIRLFSDSYEVAVKTSIFTGLLLKKLDAAQRKFVKGYGVDHAFQLQATFREVEKYYSFQHLFPPIYRLNEQEIEGARVTRAEQDVRVRNGKAKVKQLKAYLMLFEQVLANYLAQLANLGNILSIGNDAAVQGATYYAGHLYDVPAAANIISHFMKPGSDKGLVEWEGFMDDPQNAYMRFLATTLEPEHVHYDRRKRILDHLLSRFNISLVKYPMQLYHQVYGNEDDQDVRDAELQWKSELLQGIENLTAYGNHGIDYTDIHTDRRSGFEHLAAIMLYMPAARTKRLTDAFEEKLGKVRLEKNNQYKPFEEGRTVSYEVNWEQERLDMLIAEPLLDSLLNNTDEEVIEQTGRIAVPRQSIAFLKEGIERKSYRIGPEVNGKGFVVLYRPVGKRQWLRAGKFATREEAQQALNHFIQYLKDASAAAEGFYTIEHILLRPAQDEQVYGFQILDEKGGLLLQQDALLSFAEREKALEHILSMNTDIAQTSDADVVEYLKGVCEVNLSQDRNYPWLVTPAVMQQAYGEQFPGYIKRIRTVLRTLAAGSGARYPLVKKTVHYGKDAVVEDQFFSLGMTVVFPAWPARFQETDFRQFAESMFSDLAPAHIRLQFKWLGLQPMKQFENAYFNWREQLRNDHTAGAALNEARKELLVSLSNGHKQA